MHDKEQIASPDENVVNPPDENRTSAPDAGEPIEADEARKAEPDSEHSGGERDGPSVAAGRDVVADQMQFANEISNVFSQPAEEPISVSHSEEVGEAELRQAQSVYPAKEAELSAAVEGLARSRVLVVTGEPEVGKGVAALQMASRFREDFGKTRIVCIRGLDRRIRLRLESLLDERCGFGDCLVLLPNAFDERHPDLEREIGSLDANRLEHLGDRLRDKGIAILITSDVDRLPGNAQRLAGIGASLVYEGADAGQREAALRRAVEKLVGSKGTDGEALRAPIEELIQRERALLLEQLATLPQVLRFVEESLADVVLEGRELSEAIKEARDPAGRHLGRLRQESDAWAFAVALALTQAAPRQQGAPWFRFHAMWLRVLAEAQRLTREGRWHEDERTPLLKELGSDVELMRRCGATATRLPEGAAVRFREPDQLVGVWDELLGPARGDLSMLLPLLHTLCDDPEPHLRIAASQALGRIGQLDPTFVVPRFIRSCLNPRENRRRDLLGAFFQGVWGSEDKAYRDQCRHWLRHARGADVRVVLEVKSVTLAALAAVDLDAALEEFGDLLSDHLGDKAAALRRAHRSLRRAESEARSDAQLESRAAILDASHDRILILYAEDLFSKTDLFALQRLIECLVGMCLERDPITVLERIQHWLRRPKSARATLLALLFFGRYGVARTLGRIRVPTSRLIGRQRKGDVGRILAALLVEPAERVAGFVAFLEALFATFREHPPVIETGFREAFCGLLKDLCRDACAAEPRSTEELLALLLKSDNEVLARDVLEMLRSDEDFSKPNTELFRLSKRVVGRSRATRSMGRRS